MFWELIQVGWGALAGVRAHGVALEDAASSPRSTLDPSRAI